MYTVKRFKPMDTFKDETGHEYGGYECGSTVYAVLNKDGICVHRKDWQGKGFTHFYSTKKRALQVAESLNMMEGYIERTY